MLRRVRASTKSNAREKIMKTNALILKAAVALAIAAPLVASAE